MDLLQVSLESDTYSAISCDSCRRCMRLPPLHSSPPQKSSMVRHSSHGENLSQSTTTPRTRLHPSSQKVGPPDSESNRNYVTFLPAQTMYTNAANLQQTIWLQQQLFRQALNRESTAPSTPATSTRGLPPRAPQRTPHDEPVKMEWKVRMINTFEVSIAFNGLMCVSSPYSSMFNGVTITDEL